jgi:hypothetical protein
VVLVVAVVSSLIVIIIVVIIHLVALVLGLLSGLGEVDGLAARASAASDDVGCGNGLEVVRVVLLVIYRKAVLV